MRISILTKNLSSNCLGRSYILAQLLERYHEVEIIGPAFEDGPWDPIADEYPYRAVDGNRDPRKFNTLVRSIREKITGDVVYASKPRATSYGVALLATLGQDMPLVLDIDDWETGFTYSKRQGLLWYLNEVRSLRSNVNSYYYTRMLETLRRLADAQTVSNHFLKGRFGGSVIPHARNTDVFDPGKFDQETARAACGLPDDEFIVMFAGTPRPHKGVEDLLKAVSTIDIEKISAVVVGAHDSEYVDRLRRIGEDSARIVGMQPFDELPQWIAATDIVAIPQRDTAATRGQLPVKVFDAMAMEKPIIATSTSDLPKILANCGLIVPPNNPKKIREAIIKLYYNEPLRRGLARAARKKCVQEYSYDAISPKLNSIVESVY